MAFTIRHLLIHKVRGTFGAFTGQIVTGDDVTRSSVSAQIDLDSLDAGDAGREKGTLAKDPLDIAHHPVTTYHSTGLAPDGQAWQLDGELTLRGITHDVFVAGAAVRVHLRHNRRAPSPILCNRQHQSPGVRGAAPSSAGSSRHPRRQCHWDRAADRSHTVTSVTSQLGHADRARRTSRPQRQQPSAGAGGPRAAAKAAAAPAQQRRDATAGPRRRDANRANPASQPSPTAAENPPPTRHPGRTSSRYTYPPHGRRDDRSGAVTARTGQTSRLDLLPPHQERNQPASRRASRRQRPRQQPVSSATARRRAPTGHVQRHLPPGGGHLPDRDPGPLVA